LPADFSLLYAAPVLQVLLLVSPEPHVRLPAYPSFRAVSSRPGVPVFLARAVLALSPTAACLEIAFPREKDLGRVFVQF